jgi:hypothetical protein
MLGWINDCIEKLVLHKFDVGTWHAIKEKAGLSHVKDNGFLKLESYPDSTTIDLVKAASELSGLTEAQVYEVSVLKKTMTMIGFVICMFSLF